MIYYGIKEFGEKTHLGENIRQNKETIRRKIEEDKTMKEHYNKQLNITKHFKIMDLVVIFFELGVIFLFLFVSSNKKYE